MDKLADKSAVWNLSCREWAHFVKNSPAYQLNMQFVVNVIKDLGSKVIMDIGCGTGDLSKKILHSIPGVDLIYLDQSVNMLNSAKTLLRGSGRGYLLDFCTPFNEKRMLLGKNYFADLIVCHITFPLSAAELDKFGDFLNFCDLCLSDAGYVVLTLNNTALQIEEDSFDPMKDIFRQELNAAVSELDLADAYRSEKHLKIDSKELREAIDKTGKFRVVSRFKNVLPFSMRERIDLWKVPAIFDNVFVYERFNEDVFNALFSMLGSRLLGKSTQDMITESYIISKTI